MELHDQAPSVVKVKIVAVIVRGVLRVRSDACSMRLPPLTLRSRGVTRRTAAPVLEKNQAIRAVGPEDRLQGTSKNWLAGSTATRAPSIDSGLFSVRFRYVHEVAVARCMCRQFFEIPLQSKRRTLYSGILDTTMKKNLLLPIGDTRSRKCNLIFWHLLDCIDLI
jgi:hypothetical protein